MPLRFTAVRPALLLSLVWAAILLAGFDATLRRDPPPVYAADAAVTVDWRDAGVRVNESAGELFLIATLSPTSPGAVVLTFSSANLSATTPGDYVAVKRRTVVPAGQSAITVPVTVLDDALVEGDEQFLVAFSSAQPTVTLGLSQTVVTIVDDDYGLLHVVDAAAGEADGWLHFGVTRSVTSTLTTEVAYRTVDGTAAAVSDYRATTGTLVLPPGATAVTVSVAITDDLLAEPDESFTLLLENPINALLARAAATGLIRDDDPISCTLAIQDTEAGESDDLHFPISLNTTGSQTVTVDYATAPGDATPGLDYLPVSGTLAIPPSQTAVTLTVTVVDDAQDEPDKTVSVLLSNPISCTLGRNEAIGVIRDDDTPPANHDHTHHLPHVVR